MWWIKQKVHSSWFIAASSAGLVLGVMLALKMHFNFMWGAGALSVLLASFAIRWRAFLPIASVAACVVGISYGSAHYGEREAYHYWIGKEVQLRGRIKEDPSRAPSGSTSIQLDSVSINENRLSGFVYVGVRSPGGAKRGDIIEVKGVAKEGFAQFPISLSVQYLDKVIRSPTEDIGRTIRDWFADKVRLGISEPAASLGIGFLTGQKSALPEDLSEALRIVGLTHIVVASGYNLTILVQLARKLLLRVSKYTATVSASFMIVLFMAMTGLSPSMARAGLVSAMSLLAWYYGHSFHPFILLPLAAALTIIVQPNYAWGDMGWQLSFASFFGVMIVSPLLHAYFFGRDPPGVVRQVLGETISAHLVTIPVIALSFGVLSNVAIFANLLVVPFVPLAMLLTFITGVVAIFIPTMASLVALPATWLLNYMVYIARAIADIPWAQTEAQLPAITWAVYVLLIILGCLWMWRKTQYRFGSDAATVHT